MLFLHWVTQTHHEQSSMLDSEWNHPTIVVDCNNIIHLHGKLYIDPVGSVASFLDEWVQQGDIIIHVVDGATPRANTDHHQSHGHKGDE